MGTDEFLGETFEDKDWRNEGRRVKAVEQRTDHRGRAQYRVQVVSFEKMPHTIGRHSWVSAETLRTRYRKVSR